MKQALVGWLWAGGAIFGACMLVGAVAGAIAGANNPQNAAAAGYQAGYHSVLACRIYLLAGAFAIAVMGAWFRFLPGTRANNGAGSPNRTSE